LDRGWSKQSLETLQSASALEAATVATGTGTAVYSDDYSDPVDTLLDIFYPFSIPYYVVIPDETEKEFSTIAESQQDVIGTK
jgi:hypothetical protein